MNDTLDDILKDKVQKPKIRIRYLVLIGIIVILIGFMYNAIYAGIPPQDPPPEILKQYTQQYNHAVFVSGIIMNIGYCFLIVAIIFAIVRKIKSYIVHRKL